MIADAGRTISIQWTILIVFVLWAGARGWRAWHRHQEHRYAQMRERARLAGTRPPRHVRSQRRPFDQDH